METATVQSAEPSAAKTEEGLIALEGTHWGYINPDAPVFTEDELITPKTA